MDKESALNKALGEIRSTGVPRGRKEDFSLIVPILDNLYMNGWFAGFSAGFKGGTANGYEEAIKLLQEACPKEGGN